MDPRLEIWALVSRYILLRYFLIAGGTFIFLYFILYRFGFLKKLQTKLPPWRSVLLEIWNSSLTIILFSLAATSVLFLFQERTLIYQDKNEYGLLYYYLSFPIMFLMHDTYFYWVHRLMHNPSIFRYVHKVHHRSTNPTPFASYSFHVLEGVLEAAILPLIAFTLPVHREALILFLLLQFIYNVYGHTGFEIYPRWLLRTWVGKWINTSVAHNMHHKYFNGNYGLYFLFWDRWMGTLDSRYEEAFKSRKV
jgi:sterol desaturase/sphingolipid hydroxylase (fatty acid hydroxylase superfamily)